METLDDKLFKPEVGGTSSWKLLLWPVLVGFAIGATTNYINVQISYHYFVWIGHRAIGDFPPYQEIGISLLGGVGGGFWGFIFALVFLIFYTARFNRREKWPELRERFLKAGGIVTVFWLLAGLLGARLCSVDYFEMLNFFRNFDPRFEHLSFKFEMELIRFGFVAFAIWGTLIGCAVGLGWAIWDTLRPANQVFTPS